MNDWILNNMNDWMLNWTAVGALGQALSFPALCVALWGIWHERHLQQKTLENIERERRLAHYSMIDGCYQKLLELRLEDCSLGSPTSCENESKKEKYSVYAFMVWNFIETILDLTVDDEVLRRTWYPIVLYEAKQHSKWMSDPANQQRFKYPVQRWAKDPINNQYNPDQKEAKSTSAAPK